MVETYSTLVTLFTDIADAIREKTGETDIIVADDFPDVIRGRLQAISPKPYLTFSSPSSFTLSVKGATKGWNGTLEYSTDTSTWSAWDGTTTLSSVTSGHREFLYLRGIRNTVITGMSGSSTKYKWVLTGSNIACIGNIENLLDYATVEAGSHPTMANGCYQLMFEGCTGLTRAPTLPATALAENCYEGMFLGCTSLTKAPDLPATTLVNGCYQRMFSGCTGLIKAPDLPATALAEYCYHEMFYGCTGLIQAPALPAITLAKYCYYYMFEGCTGLIQAPALPATTLATCCYQRMFKGCTSLTQVPTLPATMLTNYCYYSMFEGCAKIKVSSTQTGEYTIAYRIPTTGTGTMATAALDSMFASTGGTFTGKPVINNTYYLSNTNTVV